MSYVIPDVKLSFDDVLLVPKRSSLNSRSLATITRKFTFPHSNLEWTGFPICVANMDTTGTVAMAKALSKKNMFTCLHKHYDEDELCRNIKQLQEEEAYFFYTMGIGEKEFHKLKIVSEEVALPFICVDVANGYTIAFEKAVERVRSILPNSVIMAGNVVTPNMVEELIHRCGVDIVKIGIGPGSACKTRSVTGVGYPQISAIMECKDAAHGLNGHICADGGCRYPGDVAKAFAAGADMVMLGGMFAGTEECEGEWHYDPYDGEEKVSLLFYGMSSEEAMYKYNGGLSTYRTSEGTCKVVEYKGDAVKIAQEIEGGVRSACTYIGAKRLKDMPKCATFVRTNRIHQS